MTGPVRLKLGSFRDADSFHKGSGEAIVYRGPDGSLLLRLENFAVTNGPDLRVILSPHQDPGNKDEVKTPGYIELGKLKEIVNELAEVLHLGLDGPQIPPNRRVIGHHTVIDTLDHGPYGGQRGSKVVGDRFDQLLACLLKLPLPAEAHLESLYHSIES